MKKVSEVMQEIEQLRRFEANLTILINAMKDKEFNHMIESHTGLNRRDIQEMISYSRVKAHIINSKLDECEVDM